MKIGETIRIINDIRYCCRDTGCGDFERAAYNRLIIENQWFTTGYQEVERALKQTPLNKPLPSWITFGALPEVGRKEMRNKVVNEENWNGSEDNIVKETEKT